MFEYADINSITIFLNLNKNRFNEISFFHNHTFVWSSLNRSFDMLCYLEALEK
jgi:hypothetical protein